MDLPLPLPLLVWAVGPIGTSPPSAVGEAQLPLVAQGSGFSTGHPPPDAAEMAVPSCRLLPGLLEPQAREAGEAGPGEGCPTQG